MVFYGNVIVLTLLLIETAPILQKPLRDWLEANCAPCSIRTAGNIRAALELSFKEQPRGIILDLDLLSEAEWGNLPQLKRTFPQSEIIGMGLDDTPQHRQRAQAAGIAAFIAKDRLQAELARALRTEILEIAFGRSNMPSASIKLQDHKENV